MILCMSTYAACFSVYADGSRNFIFKTVTEIVFYCMPKYDHFNFYLKKKYTDELHNSYDCTVVKIYICTKTEEYFKITCIYF